MQTRDTHSPDSQMRSCLREVAALTALPALWSRCDTPHLAEGLADVMAKMLRPTLAYVRLIGTTGQEKVEAVRLGQEEVHPGQAGEIGRKLEPWLATEAPDATLIALPHPRTGGMLQAVIAPIGSGREFGVLVVASDRPDFPTEEDRLLIGVAANQATLVLERRQAESERLRLIGQLQDVDRHKNEFLATLAHELRNPLAPIRNGLQVLRLAGDKQDTREQAQGMMERQLQQMVRLIDDLLDVSRITRNRLELRKERIALSAAVQSAVEASRPLIESFAHQLTIALPDEPIYLNADLIRLAQIIANLLTNAAKYTNRGGRIELSVRREGDEVVVSVKDNGIGIPPEHLPRLFEMFSQVASALERSQGGLGIGLALVKGLVEMHGGRVEVRSDGPGLGSEFIVRLPLLSDSSPSALLATQ